MFQYESDCCYVKERNVSEAIQDTDALVILVERLKFEYSAVGTCLAKLPWIDIDPVESFMDLSIKNLDKTARNNNEEVMKHNELFDSVKFGQKILLVGEEGFGKSTLLAKLAHEWATDNDSSLKKYCILILFWLRDLPKGSALEETLTEYCKRRLKGFENDVFIKELLKSAMHETVVLLDGFDELCEERQNTILAFLKSDSLFSPATVLITSRAVNDEDMFPKLFDRRLSLCSLNKNSFLEHVEMVFSRDENKANLINSFLELTALPFLSNLSPLLFCAIIYVVRFSDCYVFSSPSSLLLSVLKISVKKTLVKLSLSITEDELLNLHLLLGKFSFDKLHQNDLVFSDAEINAYFQDRHDVIKNMEILQPKGQHQFVMIHKMFFDILAVSYLNFTLTNILDVERRLTFLKKFLCEKENVRVSLILDSNKSTIVLSGGMKGIVYVVDEGESILSGIFMCTQDFTNFYSSFNSIPKEESSLKFSSRLLGLFRENALQNIRQPSSNKMNDNPERNNVANFFSSFGKVVFKFNRKLYAGVILREHNVRNWSDLVETLYDNDLFEKLSNKEWTVTVFLRTFYFNCCIAELKLDETKRKTKRYSLT